ncbi:hypothetical protein EYF80_003569 [Liparis tanakae]|uniref:Uncharacterized protein n=1 Tax=Liparis tanakae TaxID=230148 RepID=A0A4Z2J9Q8_9TELE|nr:hypothetical protein EYF80_003569 [Liparis tanakae]
MRQQPQVTQIARNNGPLDHGGTKGGGGGGCLQPMEDGNSRALSPLKVTRPRLASDGCSRYSATRTRITGF